MTTQLGDTATHPSPAVYLPGPGPRAGAALNMVVAVGALVGGVVGLVVEVGNGFTGTAQRYGSEFPVWIVWAAGVALGGWMLVQRARRAPWYRGWSMIEMVERPDGIVLFVGRLGRRHEGLQVNRGETVTLSADQASRTTFHYVVSTRSGSMTFSADGYVHKLTMQPLEEAAARHGITVLTTGHADRIPRRV
ncbi:hypothetical protein Cfla_0193 [Cellulomonas flavigena DSM 20109]|uniref:Uncharacterized protein n=1 Tax=Cellulomonas flavigena (strain ATCC 482 / DSM 20109 / BCRC 11376 / JCM 18109 / NBRC 3775 / NCIMB 8073 / NRS 134) TaxID=446466 RepID=D5UGC9_CELFN|nr:hypothetical protein [Cellulomonas flavigena]ADG73112.1 hypothetical protein Cfla_0193 [Cellulomonas flavigena DSM 20109]